MIDNYPAGAHAELVRIERYRAGAEQAGLDKTEYLFNTINQALKTNAPVRIFGGAHNAATLIEDHIQSGFIEAICRHHASGDDAALVKFIKDAIAVAACNAAQAGAEYFVDMQYGEF